METISVQDLINVAYIRYGQLITPPDIYQLTLDKCEDLLKSVVEEYSYYVPMTKELKINGSPGGTFLGDDIISVRNVRMDNFYFSKLSPRMDRRQRKFDPHTKMLYMPLSLPVIVECGAKYPYNRRKISTLIGTILTGDTTFSTQLTNVRLGTLSIAIGTNKWTDKGIDYSSGVGTLESIVQTDIIVTFNTQNNMLLIQNLDTTNTPVDTTVNAEYNSDIAVLQGLSLRDTRFVDLYIGRLMLALGTLKSQLIMDGDVVGFANDELMTKGQELIDNTISILMTSSTTYKII